MTTTDTLAGFITAVASTRREVDRANTDVVVAEQRLNEACRQHREAHAALHAYLEDLIISEDSNTEAEAQHLAELEEKL